MNSLMRLTIYEYDKAIHEGGNTFYVKTFMKMIKSAFNSYMMISDSHISLPKNLTSFSINNAR